MSDLENRNANANPFHLRMYIGIVLIILLTLSILRVGILSNQLSVFKSDLYEINHFKYDLFNRDVWVEKFLDILSKKIEINSVDRKEIKEIFEKLLKESIEKVGDDLLNSPQNNEGVLSQMPALLKKNLYNSLKKDLLQYTPKLADIGIELINEPKTKDQIKNIIKNLVAEDAGNQSNSKIDFVEYQFVLDKYKNTYNCQDKQACREFINDEIKKIDYKINNLLILIFLFYISLILVLIKKDNVIGPIQFSLILLSVILLLISGVFAPMINIDVEISKFSTTVIKETIEFNNQSIYHQNKSLFGVIITLITFDDFQLIFVGFLIAFFSIIFPSFKIISFYLYFYNYKNLRQKPFIKYLALNSGVLSFVDVMVVAIFIANLGFENLIKNLNSLNEESNQVHIITGGSQLQAGFYLFFGFSVLGLILSYHLKKLPEVQS